MMTEFNYATRRGIRYVVSSDDRCVVTSVDEVGTLRTLLSTYGGEQDDFVAIGEITTITSASEPSFTPVLHDFSVTASGNGGTGGDGQALRSVVNLSPEDVEGYINLDESNDGTLYRVSLGAGQVLAPRLTPPSTGRSYELIFEVTPSAEDADVVFGGEEGDPEWQFVIEAPMPTSLELGKTYCFSVIYMDGVIRPLVATSYTREAQ